MNRLIWRYALSALTALIALTPGLCQAPKSTLGAVLVGTEAQHLFKQCSRSAPAPVSGYWTPSPQDVAGLEASFPLFLQGKLPPRASPESYYRQYVGFIHKGHRMIYINALEKSAVNRMTPKGHSFDWRHKAVIICDGGQGFFGVEYDPATKKFSNLLFNGAA